MASRKRRSHGCGSLIQRGRKWYLRYWLDGIRHEEPTGKENREEADTQLTIRMGEIAAGIRVKEQPKTATMQDALKLVEDDYLAKELASIRDLRGRINLHIGPALGSRLLTEISASDIRKYVKLRRKEDAMPATINRELAAIRRAFKLASQEAPPWIETVPHIDMLLEDNVRQGFVSVPQYEAVLKELPDWAQIALVIAFHTGIRRGTILSIQRTQVDLTGKVIRLTSKQVKNRSAHVVPIYGDMGPYIDMALTSNKAYLCEERPGERVKSLREPWAEAVRAAKLPELLFHDMRRSAVRNMIRAGVPEKTAMAIAGMKTRSIVDRYNIVVEEDVVANRSRMANYLTAQKLGEELGEGYGNKSSAESNGPVN